MLCKEPQFPEDLRSGQGRNLICLVAERNEHFTKKQENVKRTMVLTLKMLNGQNCDNWNNRRDNTTRDDRGRS
jgi:hypothetical protein